MNITLTIPDNQVNSIIDDIMANFPEASMGSCLSCVGWNYSDREFRFEDNEEGKGYCVKGDMLTKAFALLFTDKWPKGCTQPPMSNDPEVWNDWLCQADATDFDAFVQLAIFGDVIYG